MAAHVKVRYLNSWWRRQIARYRGWSDGRKNFPPSETTVPIGYERTLMAFANSALADWWYKRVEDREKLEADQEVLLRRWKISEAEYDKARAKYDAHGRAPVIPLSPRIYRVVMAVLFVAELPFNWAVFKTTGEAEPLTFLMAVGVCLGVVFGAHLLGQHHRQSRLPAARRTLRTVAGTILFVGILVALNHIRVTYLVDLEPDERFIDDPAALEVCYFAVNLLFFIVGALGAYFSHDEDDQIGSDQAEMLRRDRDRHTQHEAWVRAHNHHQAVHAELAAAHRDWSANVAEVLHHYRHANAVRRETPAPAYFQLDPELQMLPWDGKAAYSDKGAPAPSYLGKDPEVATSIMGHHTALFHEEPQTDVAPTATEKR